MHCIIALFQFYLTSGLLTSYFKIVRFDATNVRRFFAHENLNQIIQTIFKLSYGGFRAFFTG